MKYITIFLLTLTLVSCDPKDLSRVLDQVSQAGVLSNDQIAGGLKEALQKGVSKSVQTLSADEGFHKSVYKILLPEEAQKITNKLKFIPGFENVEAEAIRRINRAAEDAAKKASPIFLDAIKQLTFADVMDILMGDKNAATNYLHNKTYQGLYNEFKPVIVNSLNKYKALDYWSNAVSKYNSIPFVKQMNPDLADHVSSKALVGLFDLIEKKEAGIRTDVNQRTSDLLRRVFAKQDKN